MLYRIICRSKLFTSSSSLYCKNISNGVYICLNNVQYSCLEKYTIFKTRYSSRIDRHGYINSVVYFSSDHISKNSIDKFNLGLHSIDLFKPNLSIDHLEIYDI